jgi:GNAT superfamily N-acetyltransferase
MLVKEVTQLSHTEHEQLSNLLMVAVEDGASLGFLAPLSEEIADSYWEGVLDKNVRLFLAFLDNKIVGTVQLHVCDCENGKHRAEVAKLIVHPHYRRKKIAHKLMGKLEEKALEEKRTLLVLDTRAGDVSNYVYQSIGYLECGTIPNFTYLPSDDVFQDTVLYYKELRCEETR